MTTLKNNSIMKIKHFAGYGCVTATKLSLTPSFALVDGDYREVMVLEVKVTGMHEWGLVREEWDTYTHYNWLVKRFYKKCQSETDILKIEINSVSFEECIYKYTIKC